MIMHIKVNCSQEEAVGIIKHIGVGSAVSLQLETNESGEKFHGIDIYDQLDFILGQVCKQTHLHPSQLKDKTRERPIPDARKIFCLLSYMYTLATWKQIAMRIGGRDHSTAITAKAQALDLIDTAPGFRSNVEKVEQILLINDFIKERNERA
jgi:hypothetical protein